MISLYKVRIYMNKIYDTNSSKTESNNSGSFNNDNNPPDPKNVSPAEGIIGVIFLILQLLSLRGGAGVYGVPLSTSSVSVFSYIGRYIFVIIGIILIIHWVYRKAK